MQIKNRQQLLIVLTLGVVALFAADKILLSPLLKVWDARGKRIAQLRTQVDQGKLLLVRERGLRDHWRQISSGSLTNDPSAAIEQVHQAINQWAQDSGVSLVGINPQWKTETDNYSTYECHIDASGDLARLTRFLYGAEREPIALRFQSISLAARDKEGKQLSLGLQVSALILTPPTSR